VSGAGVVATVTGEAGLGKTRLVDEFVPRCGSIGLFVRAECPNTSSAEALPLAGFRAALSDLVPDLEAREWDPGQFADQVVRRTLERCRDQPALLLVEDLHWADPSTLALVDYLARALRPRPCLVMVTVRTDPPPPDVVADVLAELERLPRAVRVELPRLTPDEVVRQLHGILGRPPAAEFASRTTARSDGVPFFVEELAAIEQIAAQHPGEPPAAPLPGRLQDVLLRRTRGLGAPTTTVLRAAAAAAGDVDEATLCAVTGLDPQTVGDVLDALVRTGRLTPSGDGYRFRHALLREAVEGDLPPREASRLHAAYGRLVDEGLASGSMTGQNRHALVMSGAYHWWRAGEDRHRAFQAAVTAAESAHRLGAFPEEQQLLQRALRLRNRDDLPDLPELSFRAAEAAIRAGDSPTAFQLYEAAWRGLDPAREPERVARILAAETVLLDALGEPLTHVESALRDLLAGLPEGPGLARSHALAGLHAFLWRRRELDDAMSLVQEALDGADADDLLCVELQLRLASLLTTRPGRVDEALDRFAEAAELGLGLGVPQYAAVALNNKSDFLVALGRPQQAAAAARDGLLLGESSPISEITRDYLVGNLADALIALGDLEGAQAVLEERLRVDRAYLERGTLYLVLGLVRLRRGELAEAMEAAAAAHQRLDGRDPDPQVVVPLATLDAELALAHGDPDRALEVARDALATHAHHVWGWLAWALAAAAARAAAATHTTPRWLVTEIDELDALHRRAAPAHPNSAEQVRATLAAQDRPANAHAGTRTRTLTGPGPRREGARAELTSRELEVLRLVACGLSNPAIAADLVISPKTASVHVSHILTKLGARSRGEAVAVALRRGTLAADDFALLHRGAEPQR
jgi:DNA-binding CsgD family transcriptional regulator/tetratricopeptide (TPR) repeat protein